MAFPKLNPPLSGIGEGDFKAFLRPPSPVSHGHWPANALVVIAGQKPLNTNTWAGLMSQIAWKPLIPFTPEEVDTFLRRAGINDPHLIQPIADQTGGLPLAVNNIASQKPQTLDDLGELSDNLYDLYFGVIADPQRRELATHAALARIINQDVIEAITGAEQAGAAFEWLQTKTSFLEKRRGGSGWDYHDLIRAAALDHVREQSRQTWKDLHLRLAGFYEAQRQSLGLKPKEALNHHEYQDDTLELLYHQYCSNPAGNQAFALNTIVEALRTEGDFDLRCAMTLQQGEKDCHASEPGSWGNLLVDGLRASYEHKNLETTITMCDRLLQEPQVKKSLTGLLYWWRGVTHLQMGQVDASIQDTTRAIELEPNNAHWYISRAKSYEANGQPDLAAADRAMAAKLSESPTKDAGRD